MNKQMKTENCDKCGIKLDDSSITTTGSYVGDGVYCTPHWPTTGYWKYLNASCDEYVCQVCDLPMLQCVKSNSNCENNDCEDEQKMMNENENETKPDCGCPTNSEVIA